MIVIEDYCIQPRKYADSEGWLKIELEPGDNREEIIKKYNYVPTMWCEESCLFMPEMSSHTLLVFRRKIPFVD